MVTFEELCSEHRLAKVVSLGITIMLDEDIGRQIVQLVQ